MLVRIVVPSKVRGEQLVLIVRIIVRVFLQMYMGCLGKKCVGMIGGFRHLWNFLVCCRWGLVWELLISNFGKVFTVEFFTKKFHVCYSILQKKGNKRMVAKGNVMIAFYKFAYSHYQ